MLGVVGLCARRGWRWISAVVIVVLCNVAPALADANDRAPLSLEGNAASFSLNGHIATLDDPDGTFDIKDVVQASGFQAISSGEVEHGLTSGAVWCRFTVLRVAGMPADWVLALDVPFFDDIRAFVPAEAGGFTETRLGRHIPSSQLPLAARNHVVGISLPEGRAVSVYLRLSSLQLIRVQAALWRPEALLFDEVREASLVSIYCAVLAIIIVASGLLGAWLWDNAMLAYALYVGTVLSRVLCLSGILFVLFPDAGRNANYLLLALGHQGGVAAFTFMWDKILDLKRNFPVMHRIYLMIVLVAAASLLTALSPSHLLFARMSHIAMVAIWLSSITLALLQLRRTPQEQVIKLYLLAFILVSGPWMLELGAQISSRAPAYLIPQIDVAATLTHIIILSVALAYRMRLVQLEQIRAEIAFAGERLARQRQQTFIDMASHEFKTPLAIIDSAVQVLELLTAPCRQEVTDRYDVIRRAVQRSLKLIETCLGWERDTELAVVLKPIIPAELLERVAKQNREMRRDELIVPVLSGVPETCIADGNLLGIALDALIDNARRYGPADQSIEIRAFREDGWITFAVLDRGPGIPPEEAAHVFEKYYRGVSSAMVPGTGIGLHLVKAIAELHGGRVSYRRRQGGGASFFVTIPDRD
jgi:signal transduction histidine kinase